MTVAVKSDVSPAWLVAMAEVRASVRWACHKVSLDGAEAVFRQLATLDPKGNWFEALINQSVEAMGLTGDWQWRDKETRPSPQVSGLYRGLYFCGMASGMSAANVAAMMARERSSVITGARKMARDLGWVGNATAELMGFATSLGLVLPVPTRAMLTLVPKKRGKTARAAAAARMAKMIAGRRAKLSVLIEEHGTGLSKLYAGKLMNINYSAFEGFVARHALDIAEVQGWIVPNSVYVRLSNDGRDLVDAMHKRLTERAHSSPANATSDAEADAQERDAMRAKGAAFLGQVIPEDVFRITNAGGVRRAVYPLRRSYLPDGFGGSFKQDLKAEAR